MNRRNKVSKRTGCEVGGLVKKKFPQSTAGTPSDACDGPDSRIESVGEIEVLTKAEHA